MLSPEPSSDRPIESLPRWLLRHIVRPENHRLVGKKPKFFPGESYWSRGASHYNAHGSHHAPIRSYSNWDAKLQRFVDKPPHSAGKVEEIPHLNMNDYRLWAQVRWPGAQSDSSLIMARCRWCHERFPLREFKQVVKTHKERCHFTYNLREVYGILLQKGQCVVCNVHTKANRWGIPLCGDGCEKAWMYATEHSERLGCAIIDARVAGRIRENTRGVVHASFTD
jgi:hypothetical protein